MYAGYFFGRRHFLFLSHAQSGHVLLRRIGKLTHGVTGFLFRSRFIGKLAVTTTLDTYTHASAQMFADAVEKLW